MSNKDDVQVGISADTRGIEASIKNLTTVMTTFGSNVNTMGTKISDAMAGIDSAIGKLGKTSTSSSSTVVKDLKAIEDQAKKTATSVDAGGRTRTSDGRFAKASAPIVSTGDVAAIKAASSATADLNTKTNSLTDSVIAKTSADTSARYALYDVSRAYALVGGAMLAASIASVKTSADMESAFTNVERTLGSGTSVDSVNEIRKSLIDLSTQIPKTFGEVSTIATLGNQLGVTQGNLIDFTTTVTQFSATTGLGIEATAQAFGLLGNLLQVPVEQYRFLASSIALVGLNSVATEAQIISVSQQIAAGANSAGFAADQVIGLSAALASLKVSPEQSRSSLTTYFNAMNKAAAEGGPELEKFAQITGLTSDKIDTLIRSGNGGQEIFTKFLAGLNQNDNVGTTKALDDLGLSGLRVDNTFRRLSQNPGLVASTFKDAKDGMVSGTEASRQYSLVADDLNQTFIMLQNSISGLVGRLGSDLLPVLSSSASFLRDAVNGIRVFADTSWGKGIFGFGAIVGAAIGVTLLFNAAILATTATSLALSRAQGFLAKNTLATTLLPALQTAKLNLLGLSGANVKTAITTSVLTGATYKQTLATAQGVIAETGMTRARVVGTIAINGMKAAAVSLNAALGPIGWTVLIVAGLVALSLALSDVAKQSTLAGLGLTDVAARATAGSRDLKQLGIDAGITLDALDKVARQRKSEEAAGNKPIAGGLPGGRRLAVDISPSISGAKAVAEQMTAIDTELAKMINSGNIEEVTAQLAEQGYTAAIVADQLPAYSRALNVARNEESRMAVEKYGTDLIKAKKRIQDATKALKDLGSASDGAAKPIRTLSDYANDLANVFKRSFSIRFDKQASLDKITSGFADLKERVDSARISLLSLSADKSVKEYFLSIANAYGDTLRAGVLTAEIAKINSDIADTQANASTELTGNSKAAIKNRQTVTGLVGSYDDYIKSLSESGASQKTLQDAIKQGKADFVAQATQLGFSSAELVKYSSHFDDLKIAVSNVPKNITVTANMDPALQAMNEFIAKSKVSGAAAGSAYGKSFARGQLDSAYRAFNDMQRLEMKRLATIQSSTVNPRERANIGKQIDAIKATLVPGFSTGGYTGSGGKFDVAGLVHKGEYVVPKSQVNQSTGLPYEGALSQMKNPTYFNGGPVSGNSGMMVVSLSPEDRGLLRQIGGSGQVVLYANNEAIARSSSAGSKSIVASGGRL
jgi:TP901 family phage tail tape measure protein